jgi:MerR family transcriptional regulator/heat shock protein HspR
VYRKEKRYTISVVAERYDIHQQTLRLYEREGLLAPSRSQGNTRLYTESDLERLETILSLTRDLGVNLAGVAIVLDMREKMERMRREFEQFLGALQGHVETQLSAEQREAHALVPLRPRPPIPETAERGEAAQEPDS